MCGVLGYSGRFAPELIAQANSRQGHRGPDDRGEFIDAGRGLGLGHLRLSIVELSALGHQPMSSADGNVVLVFNGEIYNFRDLRAELEAAGTSFRGHSDTEVLLELYLSEGVSMVSRLNGMFAFAIWDRRNESLFMARDALGIKPLYYSETTAGFAFASEIKALLRLAPETTALNVRALHRYLSFLWCPGDETPLQGVRKLPPGEAMVVQSGRVVRRWAWYQLPVFEGRRAALPEAAAVSGTEAGLRTAVHRQLVADVPVGAFLSGGLDSSAVVAFAREKAPEIRCFTIEPLGGQDDGLIDDLPYAKRVAAHLDVRLEVVPIDSGRMAADLEGMVAHLDEPLADLAALNVFYISRLARQTGIKVLLSGAGGDDVFSGYRRHAALHYEAYWRWLPLAVRTALESATASLDQRSAIGRRLTKAFDGARLSGDAHLAHYFVWTKEAQLRGLYTPEFRAELGQTSATEPMTDFLKPLPPAVAPLDRMLTLEQRFFLADHNLTYTDKMSMAAGVEVRVPFLDVDLIEHASRVPPRLKQRGATSKWVLKKAMEPYLPADVIYRPKAGFGVPLRRWMRRELRALLGDLLSADSLRRRGLFDPTAVHRLIAQNDSGQVDAAYTLLSLLAIEIWCREYLDGSRFRLSGTL